MLSLARHLRSARGSWIPARRLVGLARPPLGGLGWWVEPLRVDFHTSPARPIPPMVVALFKPLSRITAVVFGRRIRIWWRKLPEDKRTLVRDRVRRSQWALGGTVYLRLFMQGPLGLGGGFKPFTKESRRETQIVFEESMHSLGVGLTVLLLYLYESHIQVCPLTGRKRLLALEPDQIEKISLIEFEQILATHEKALIPDGHPIYERVAGVAQRILRANRDIPEVLKKSWTISVIDAEERNAFVLPSGNIFVFTGMLEVCENDDQLGFVLSHEIAHTLLNHVAEKLSYVNVLYAIVLVPLALLWAVIPSDGIALVTDWFFNQTLELVFELPFSRDMETEADEVGLELAAKACLDLRQAPLFWGKMRAIEADDDVVEVPEILQTHPNHENRQAYLESLLPQALKRRDAYGCQSLCGPDPVFSEYLRAFQRNWKPVARPPN
eukprot:maker-scaffold1959_size23944-snap-gene-0.7 protein:Tk11220 transcript:maker-scaffold1959_size23944-snap-gene-0.7-mRNA-1 annotation:"metalloendopeptidase OMA1 "